MQDAIQKEMTLNEKLNILSDAAKYDVSCSSSGVERKGDGTGTGNCSKAGICHSFSADGRCISLLKILFTNECIYDCKYCINALQTMSEELLLHRTKYVHSRWNFTGEIILKGCF